MIGIYCIENKINNKKYIGQSIDLKDRLAHHLSSLRHNRHENSHLQNSFNKYGESKFDFYIVEICEENELDESERYYIKELKSTNWRFGYNNETGGNLNKHMSEESKIKMSIAKQGMYDGEKNPMYGIHLSLSEERKMLQKEISTELWKNPEYREKVISGLKRSHHVVHLFGEDNPMFGKNHSEETKLKMRANNKKKIPVICIETGEIFESACEAGRQMNLDSNHINKCCNGKSKSHKGFHFEFYNANKHD